MNDINALHSSLVSNPVNADVLCSLGAAFLDQGKLNGALHYFAQAIAANPRHLQAARSHQVVLEKLGLIPKIFTNRFMRFHLIGKPYYMPIPEEGFVDARLDTLFDLSSDCYEQIDIDAVAQLKLLTEFAAFHDDMPFTGTVERGRYRRDNSQFFEMDAAVLYCMLRLKQPRRVIEVGSGYSSAVMLDANDALKKSGQGIRFTFIDPDCSRLKPLLAASNGEGRSAIGEGEVEVIEDLIQNVDPAIFDDLGAGDILFIDSSHVVKLGSDVCLFLGQVLPRLRDGVIIHFHDIFHNFEYPRIWAEQIYPWNESYALKYFLMYNEDFKVLFFNSYLAHRHSDTVFEKLPLVRSQWDGGRWFEKSWGGRRGCAEKAWMGGSLWLVKNSQ